MDLLCAYLNKRSKVLPSQPPVPPQSAEGDRRSSEGRVDLGIIQWLCKEDDDKEDDDKEDPKETVGRVRAVLI